MSDQHPKVFVSYSWTSSEHEAWVVNLAEELVENGVDVILDKWALKDGHDTYAFMETMVSDPEVKKVLLICDKGYAEKADDRSGGVGTETQIITPELYRSSKQEKFVAALAERDEFGNPYLPTYYKSKKYIDVTVDRYASGFEQLLRWVFDKPLYIKPDMGKAPRYIVDRDPISIGTSSKHRTAVDSIRNDKPSWKATTEDYFEVLQASLEKLRITPSSTVIDELVIENVAQFLPYRNEAIEIFVALAKYRDCPESASAIHRFFESIIPYLAPPPNLRTWREEDLDNFRFIIQELFLYAVACLLKHERFESVAMLLDTHYYVEKPGHIGKENMLPFSVIWKHMGSLNQRNSRLNLRRLSLRADLLEERSSGSGVSFRLLMQADFVLFTRDAVESLKSGSRQSWHPDTLLYVQRNESVFEVFARSRSCAYFEKLQPILGVESKDDLMTVISSFSEGKLRIPQWEFESFSPELLMGIEQLATRK